MQELAAMLEVCVIVVFHDDHTYLSASRKVAVVHLRFIEEPCQSSSASSYPATAKAVA
jgi:hypothetical protein